MTYSESILKLLSSISADTGDVLSVVSRGRSYRGTLMPHHDLSSPDVLIIKLGSGYNVGVRIYGDSTAEVVGKHAAEAVTEATAECVQGLPRVAVIGAGGTISSRMDRVTGTVRPMLSASAVAAAAPEVSRIACIEARSLFSLFSDSMDSGHWQELARAAAAAMDGGAEGIVILHGTDTMGYTAAALSFMLQGASCPVVLVGAQRSSDRPSSDAPSNLTAAVRFCVDGGRKGVFVVMHDTLGDDSFAVHLGTRVRKMHTSRRDAFRSSDSMPVAHIDADGRITYNDCMSEPAREPELKDAMEKRTLLLQAYPGMDPAVFEDAVMGSRGVVIAGFGMGHTGTAMIPLVKKACDAGITVVIASQCLGGTTDLTMYETGRALLQAGAVPAGDMLPETAYVKLMWALANHDGAEEVGRIMQTPLAGEMSDRRTADV
ncbi:MAG: Glu-tRNA(Gln) amidotransferase subunit GatD [Euryarchaeota archaeon]|nr:Glu-tRNA(Gln) amidotransferase subunit GatD [Euryarchaeota archaeon]